MSEATRGQISKILDLLKGVPSEKVQEILERGLLSDIFNGKLGAEERNKLRHLLGLPPFEVILRKRTGGKKDCLYAYNDGCRKRATSEAHWHVDIRRCCANQACKDDAVKEIEECFPRL